MPRRPKIEEFGTDAFGIRVTGDPRNMEPSHTRIVFPGGEVDVVRAGDGAGVPYWIHVTVNHPEAVSYDPESPAGRICDARLDQTDKPTADANVGDFDRPQLYHLAVRVERTGK
jgi:hypothetical protein